MHFLEVVPDEFIDLVAPAIEGLIQLEGIPDLAEIERGVRIEDVAVQN
jgi:hypothetical protein